MKDKKAGGESLWVKLEHACMHVTLHQLFLVYGVSGNVIRESEGLIRELAQEIEEDSAH